MNVIVLIQTDDGDEYTWTVTDPDVCRWDIASYGPYGPEATLTVRGRFHRRKTTLASREISNKMHSRLRSLNPSSDQ